MGKITVKHYLNMNLKPYVVRGENYYSMYIMVVVNRKNTKVKSISFEELYTEKDFEEIQNENNDLLNREIIAIENICLLIQDIFGDFDASVFSAYYSSMNDLFIDSVDFEENNSNEFDLWSKKGNSLNLEMESFVFGEFSRSVNKTHGMNLFTWFSETGQKELSDYLQIEKVTGDFIEIINMLNKLVFLGSMYRFSEKLSETKKGRELYDRHSDTIDNDYWRFFDDIKSKYSLNK